MTVNSGSPGAEISLQDLQDAYGGSHPISLSEYYRGGVEVPSTSISGNNPYTGQTNFSGSGSGSGGSDGIAVNVNTTPGMTVPGSLSIQGVGVSSRVGNWFFSGSGPEREGFEQIRFDSSTSFARLQWGRTQGGNTWSIQDGSTTIQSGTGNQNVVARGPAWVSGDSGLGLSASQVAAAPQLSASGRLTIGYRGNASSRGTSTGRGVRGPSTTTPTTHDITFTNNTGQIINVTSVSPGSTSNEVARGATFGGGTDLSSDAWSFTYDYTQAGGGSGVDDETNGGVVTDVTTNTGSTSIPSSNTPAAASSSGSYTVTANDAFIQISAGASSGDERVSLTISAPGTTTFTTNRIEGGVIYGALGPRANQSFSGWRGIAPSGGQGRRYSAGTTITATSQQRTPRFDVWRATTTPTTYDVSFRNDNPESIILDPSSTGGSRTLTSGQTAQVLNDASSPNWNFNYRYAPSSQPANTAIPSTVGDENSLDQYNTPGNFAG